MTKGYHLFFLNVITVFLNPKINFEIKCLDLLERIGNPRCNIFFLNTSSVNMRMHKVVFLISHGLHLCSNSLILFSPLVTQDNMKVQVIGGTVFNQDHRG